MKGNDSLNYIEISKDNLIYNFTALKKLTKKGTLFSVAVKGNAYGHGQQEVVEVLDPHVDYFQVDSIEEFEFLRLNTSKKTLLLGAMCKEGAKKILSLGGCIPSIFSLEELNFISMAAKKVNVVQEVCLPVDAYLGREGFGLEELPEILNKIKKDKSIKLHSVYAHFANIEDTNNFTHAKKQIDKYKEILNLVKESGFKDFLTHISATSGLLMHEKDSGANSLIRLGIGVYGLWPSRHIKFAYKGKLELRPVLSWKSKVVGIRDLPAGRTIGYGLSYMTYKDIRIAIIPQGYADGLDRGLSSKGEVLISGKRCKILGRVSMNMCTVDVTELSDVRVGDEVVILGRQGERKIDAEEIADHLGTINYEVVTRISSLLPRFVV